MPMPSSEKGEDSYGGKYPVKVYTIDGVLIYQAYKGDDNTSKTPLGGIISQKSAASSMLDAIANPIIFYYGSGNPVINQEGHSGDLYDYYWTSYSRGTDGRWRPNEPSWHNVYLDGYIPLRVKSIYDPCPYLYRIPSNGTFNQVVFNTGWTNGSYLAGVNWNMNTLDESWLPGLGMLNNESATFEYAGREGWYSSGTTSSQLYGYVLQFTAITSVNCNRDLFRSYGISVRCIED